MNSLQFALILTFLTQQIRLEFKMTFRLVQRVLFLRRPATAWGRFVFVGVLVCGATTGCNWPAEKWQL